MTVSSVSSSSGTSSTSATASSDPYANLGMKDFLKLLTTQLKSQDPTQPQDNTQMVAQMAQFSSLSGIGELNTTLSSISTKLDSIMAAQAAATSASTTTTSTVTATDTSSNTAATA